MSSLQFLRQLVRNPKRIGAITPSSSHLAQAIAMELDPSVQRRVVELGPGSGVVTQALLDRGIAEENLILVEDNYDFAKRLAGRFPRAKIHHGDAFNHRVLTDLGSVDAVVSGIPLLNYSAEVVGPLFTVIASLLNSGGCFLQFTYSGKSPGGPHTPFKMEKIASVHRNLPPATVWRYQKP